MTVPETASPPRALHHGVRVGDHRTLTSARDERARVGVRAVGEGLRDDGQPGPAGRLQEARARQPEHRRRAAREEHAVGHGRGLRLVPHDPVVQGAVRLDARHARAGGPGEDSQGTDLVGHLGRQLVGRDVHGTPSEARQIPIGDLGADHHAPLGRRLAHPPHGDRVPRVEAARHVGADDDREQALVIGEPPAAEALAEIGVEVDRGDVSSVSALRRGIRAISPRGTARPAHR
ncbi:hypothetical protein J2S54_005779 [Streptomyces sp. DSM 42143]|nr:hypothetical protein [Streptomyces sp. DSM 42143]